MLWYSEITAKHLSDRLKESVKESEGGEKRAGVTLLQIRMDVWHWGMLQGAPVFISDLLMALGHKKTLS